MQVHVRDNNVDQALKALKKKMQREGIFREMKLRNFYEKPSVVSVSVPRMQNRIVCGSVPQAYLLRGFCVALMASHPFKLE